MTLDDQLTETIHSTFAGYALSLGAAPCRELLAATAADAQSLLLERMPVPKLLETDQGGSQVRYALNPTSDVLVPPLCVHKQLCDPAVP